MGWKWVSKPLYLVGEIVARIGCTGHVESASSSSLGLASATSMVAPSAVEMVATSALVLFGPIMSASDRDWNHLKQECRMYGRDAEARDLKGVKIFPWIGKRMNIPLMEVKRMNIPLEFEWYKWFGKRKNFSLDFDHILCININLSATYVSWLVQTYKP